VFIKNIHGRRQKGRRQKNFPWVSVENFQEEGREKRPKNSTIMPLPGKVNGKKDRKTAKKTEK